MTVATQKKLGVIVFLILVLEGVIAFGLLGRDTKPQPKPAPAFDLEVLEPGTGSPAVLEQAGSDGRISLAELRGTPVVLNVWASWCEACRVETPVLEDTWKRAAAEGVVVLGVDTSDVSEDARVFLADYEVTYPTVSDVEEDTADRYGVTALPTTYFIDADGRIVDQIVGALSAAQLEQGIDAARDVASAP